MKQFRKMLALIMTAIMITASFTVSAFADEENYDVVVENSKSGFEYRIYQMLTGTITTIGDRKVFSNVQWGTGVKPETIEIMYNMAHLEGASRTPAKFAAWLGDQETSIFHAMMNEVGSNNGQSLDKYVTLDGPKSHPVKGTDVTGYVAENLEPGYYLIRNTAVPAGETFSDYIVFVLEDDMKISPKSAPSPVQEKKVTDKNDSSPDAELTNATQDSADYDIGDAIPYTLTVRLPSNYTSYDKYKLVFSDEMSKGLSFDGKAKIYFGAEDTAGSDITFTATSGSTLYTDGGNTYTYTIDDLKADAYKSYNLTNSSVITIKYTAVLNKDAVIGEAGNPNAFSLQYSNHPTDTSSVGTTEKDITTVFTFKLVFNKVDGDSNPLSGAEFILYKWVEEENDWINVTNLGTDTDKPTLEKSGTDAVPNSIFTFKGLDDGKYKLHESETPAGYNTIEDFEFTVTAQHDDISATPQLIALSGSNDNISFVMSQNVHDGSLTANIKNESGSVLPTTGAKGTTIMVLAGSVLAFIGIAVLVTFRRMSAE